MVSQFNLSGHPRFESGQNLTVSCHAGYRMQQRKVSLPTVLATIEHPLAAGAVRSDLKGRSSQRLLGSKAVVIWNPTSEQVVTVYKPHLGEIKRVAGESCDVTKTKQVAKAFEFHKQHGKR